MQVIDGVNDTASTLGDFHSRTAQGTTGYAYDGNGNLKIDNNKEIDSIQYNYLNLPQSIHVRGKGTITYTYDATGTKVRKTTTDSLARHSTTTLYLGDFIYQQSDSITNPDGGIDTLQFIQHEEGRTRWALHQYIGGTSGYGFEYDFYERDHLGNTRVLLSQEKDTAQYIATMEPANRATENALFYNIDSTSYATTSVPGGYPGGTNGGANDSVAMVSGSQGDHTQGPALILKVMAGDSVSFGVNSYFVGGGTADSTSSSLSSVLSTLAGGLVSLGAGGGEGGTFSALNNSPSSPVLAALNSFFPTNDPTPASTPKAYLNWMLLDNQFNSVSGYNQSGALPVGSPNVLNTLATTIKLHHSGYLYIWVSNETQNWMVFFDNLSVEHFSGPMVEENHYYPFGLLMNGISDKALKTPYAENKYRFNGGSELQDKEFSDGSGLEMYDADFRGYDPQLGRFWQIDPLADVTPDWSPYSFVQDNPISFNDPLGLDDSTESLVPYTPKRVPVQTPQCLTCQLPKPDPGGTVGPPPSSVPAPINYYSSDLSYLYDKFDNSPTVIAILGGINEYNPLANAVNAIDTYITGHDTRDRKQTNAQATVQLASALPIGKAAVGLSMLENVVMGEGISVLGSYPGYIELADQLAARRFSIPVNIWNSMTPEQQWAANVKFLDRMISRGDNIVLSTSAFNAKAGTTFYRELQYLYSKGYKVSSGGMLLSK